MTSHHAAGAVGRARRLRREMTRPEKLLWEELRALKLNIRRQAPIGRYIADFVSHHAALIIELDGPVHDRPEGQLYDLERTAWLNSQGYKVLRFRNEEVIADAFSAAARVEALMLGKAPPPAPISVFAPPAVDAPPTPALPPLRGKGE